MAQLTSRANLSAARHPLVSAFAGRTIILPQYDMNYQRNAIFAGGDQDRDIGIPQVFYMHNCMPTEQGYQSIGFNTVILPKDPAEVDFDQAITLTDPAGNKFLFVPAAGKNYVFDAPVLEWASVSPITGLSENVLVTTAFVQGNTYVFYQGEGCFKYNNVTKAFDAVTLTGLVIDNIVGILGSNGYLLAWDINGVLYWSSATNPLDFVPSLITGAGSGAITDLKGRLIVILPTVNGFIVYGSGNAVGGSYSGNLRFPFTLKEIPGAGGVRDKEHVSFESNMEKQYALTSAGLQAITKTGSEVILPDTADFITNHIFEDFNTTTNTFTVTYTTGDLFIKLTVVGSRYFVISYGTTAILTHALIYDIIQKKWGKVKINHVDCFQYTYPNLYGEITYDMLLALGTTYDELMDTMYTELNNAQATAERPRRTIGFLQRDGTVRVLNFDLGALDHDAVFILGKYQFVRNDVIQLSDFDVESIDQGSNFSTFILPSFDGKNFQAAVVPFLKTNIGYLRKYQKRMSASNISLGFKGTFNLVSVLVTYAKGGLVRAQG